MAQTNNVAAYINDTYTGFDSYERDRLREHGQRLVDLGRDDWRETLDGLAARMAVGREVES